MIRLVASDLDGTLMHSDRSIPESFYTLYREMERRGILFCAASGNQPSTLLEILAPVAETLTYLPDNGARVVYRGELIDEAAIPVQALLSCLDILTEFPDLMSVCSGPEDAMLYESDRYRADPLLIYLKTHRFVDDLRTRPEHIYKLAISAGGRDITPYYNAVKPLLPDGVQLNISGNGWMDIISTEAGKGKALARLQKHLGIAPEETVVFGDQMNDADMANHASLSYAVANADPALLKYFNRTAPSNDEDGVVTVLRSLLS